MIVIGLTGGIASGKSTISRLLTERGAVLLDADKVGHEALQPHTQVWEEIIAAFGTEILLPNGEVNRRKLGEIVFNNVGARMRLNQIMHPQMYLMMKEKLEKLRQQGVGVVILEAAVLLEANWTPLVNQVWVAVVSEETAVHRLQDRNGLSREQALARIRSQLSSEERIRHTDVVVDTDCSLPEVEARVDELWQRLQASVKAKEDQDEVSSSASS